MRLVKVNAAADLADKVIKTAFGTGVEHLSSHKVQKRSKDGEIKETVVIDIETSTPQAKLFVDRLLDEDYYDTREISFNTRQPRSIVSEKHVRELTVPLVEPPSDLYFELWQFSHVTYGLVGRIFVSACLLAYGLIEARTLLIVAGLLFLPLLPMVMAISYGIAGRQPTLALQGLYALSVSTLLLLAGGTSIAMLCQPPMRSDDLVSPGIAILICVAVGIAAALASEDDAGRRELIGLAAASQIGIIPVMLGIGFVYGTPLAGPDLTARAGSFAANIVTIGVSVMVTQYVTGVVGNIRRLRRS